MAQRTRLMRLLVLLAASAASMALAQTPQPFPQPGSGAARTPQAPASPPPAAPTTAATATQPAPAAGAPTEATLGFPIYPNAVFLRSYDAGRNQRYYVFGVATPFADLVTYYRNVLKERGNVVFEAPPTHVFEVGRYREETMAFPPSVTIKDYTFSGSAGYPNPTPGAQPERFPTIIQIVPAPSTAPPGGDLR